MQAKQGFTLVELLITLAILAIISMIAIPSYLSYLTKSRRSDAMNTLLAISLAQERFRASNPTYGTLSQIWPSTTSHQGYYTLSVSNNSATTYTITAQGTGSQLKDAEGNTSCATMVLSLSNGTISQTPTLCWPS